jgi:hypothetical protein
MATEDADPLPVLWRAELRSTLPHVSHADQVEYCLKNELAEAVVDDRTDTYAFATSGHYVGNRNLVTEIIETDELLRFVREHPDLLPSRVRGWFDLTM